MSTGPQVARAASHLERDGSSPQQSSPQQLATSHVSEQAELSHDPAEPTEPAASGAAAQQESPAPVDAVPSQSPLVVTGRPEFPKPHESSPPPAVEDQLPQIETVAEDAAPLPVSANPAGRPPDLVDAQPESGGLQADSAAGPTGTAAFGARAAQQNPAQTHARPSQPPVVTGRPEFPNTHESLPISPVKRPLPKVERIEQEAVPPPVSAPPVRTSPDPADSQSDSTGMQADSHSVQVDSVNTRANPLSAQAEEPSTEPVSASTPEQQRLEEPRESSATVPGIPVPGIPAEPSLTPETLAAAEIEELNFDELMADSNEEPAIRAGDLRTGQVVSVEGENVIVDYGGKTEGIVPLAELQQAGAPVPMPGQEIEVTVESRGGPGDYAVLSFLKAHQSRVWERIEAAYRQQEVLTAKVVERVKGGLGVDIGMRAFLPGSQADVRPVSDLDALLGQEIPVRIVKLSKGRGNVVVSRRALLEEELQERRRETLAGLAAGATVTGTIKNVTNYGAFVDLGGIDGLLHVTDISWGRIRNPEAALHAGEEITLKVLKFDPEKERVSLSLKHLHPDPWENVAQHFHEGGQASGRVVSITDYGAFVELDSGLEGLIHVSELSWSKRLKHPAKMLKLDQQIQAVITQINSAERRISLSLKRLQPDPWCNLGDRYPVGQVIEGRVRNLTSYGAFVEIEEGVDGLVHVSDLSWSAKVKHPKDELKKGQVIRAVVLRADEENRRLSLGIKQLEPDVWEKFFSMHLAGDDVKGQITRFAKFGAFVELAPGVEGLCHNSEMSAHASNQRKPPLRAGQEYEFRIIKLDEFDKKISLSRRAYELAHHTPASNGNAPALPVESVSEAAPSFSEETA